MAIGHMLLNATEAFLPDSEEEDEDERGSIRNEGREMSSASSGGGGRAGQQQGQAHTSEACKKAELMCRWAAAIPIYIYSNNNRRHIVVSIAPACSRVSSHVMASSLSL